MGKHPTAPPLEGAGIPPALYATLGLGLDTRQGIAYASVEGLIAQYCERLREALDYGCGPGRSTRLLRQLGFEHVTGVDVHKGMLRKARKLAIQGTSYQHISSGVLPFDNQKFDLAFSGLVLPEISRQDEIPNIFGELKRVTADDGTIMILTCTKEGYVTDTGKFTCLLSSERKANLKDGDAVLTGIAGSTKKFNDYYWSDPFLRRMLEQTGLTVVNVCLPVATPEQIQAAPHLTKTPSYAVYVCKKAESGITHPATPS